MRREEKGEAWLVVARLVLGFAIFVALVSLIAWAFREPLTRFGASFVGRFGLAGMGIGAFLADSVHFPIPPQFYLLTGIAGGRAHPGVVGSVLAGSELGGLAAFALGRALGNVRALSRRTTRERKLLTDLVARRGMFGLALATLLPVSFCLLCLSSGAMRLPYRAYAVLGIMRIPRIALSYAVIVLAWS